jgi:cyclase
MDWVTKVADLGAGEILLTSVDMEGTGRGYDMELIKKISEMADIPVIACGGAGNRMHIRDAVLEGRADAVCAASVFHYALVDRMAELGQYKEEGNIEFLKKRLPISTQGRKGIEPTTISELKRFLIQSGVNCRIIEKQAAADRICHNV